MLLACLLFLVTACSSNSNQDTDGGQTGSSSVVATSTPPDAPPTATPTPQPESPAQRDVITAENFTSLETVTEASLDGLQFLAWLEDGRLLVASADNVLLIDPETDGTEVVHSAAGQERILALSTQGDIATARPDSEGVDIRDITGEIRASIDMGQQFGSVVFSRDGSLLATTRLEEIAVDVWSTLDGAPVYEASGFETAAPVYSASLGPDNRTLLWHARATLQVTNLDTGEMTPEMQHEEFVSSFAFSTDARLLATTWADHATIWDPATGGRLQDLDQTVPAFELAFLPGTNLLMVASDDGVRLSDAVTYESLGLFQTAARNISVSGDGTLIATVDQGGFVTIWGAGGT